MAEVRLFDTLSREIRPLRASDNHRLRMYVCGPTVHGPAHIGNFLTFVRFDLIYRLARVSRLQPYYVRNITDVDDKTIAKARAAGESLEAFTTHWTDRFHEDCARLNLLTPDHEPRATRHIREQITLIEKLIEGEHAYVGRDGSVYFRVKSFEGYGKLSHFDPDFLQTQSTTSAGTPNQADEYTRDAVADFALWKARKEEDGENFWDSPWGQGRPGWHLECSAMSMKYLGDTFDLHGGGEDLCFPHHENEIAQSEAVTGQPLCHHWVHGVHLLVEGRKMSKSLGNFFTVEDLLDKGYSPPAVRLTLLSGHYRQQLNFSLASVEAAESALSKIERQIRRLLKLAQWDTGTWESLTTADLPSIETHAGDVWRSLCDDLNTPAALGALHQTLRDCPEDSALLRERLPVLKTLIEDVLGLHLRLSTHPAPPDEVQALAEQRWQAKQDRQWETADSLRERIREQGWQVLDRKDGYDIEPL